MTKRRKKGARTPETANSKKETASESKTAKRSKTEENPPLTTAERRKQSGLKPKNLNETEFKQLEENAESQTEDEVNSSGNATIVEPANEISELIPVESVKIANKGKSAKRKSTQISVEKKDLKENTEPVTKVKAKEPLILTPKRLSQDEMVVSPRKKDGQKSANLTEEEVNSSGTELDYEMEVSDEGSTSDRSEQESDSESSDEEEEGKLDSSSGSDEEEVNLNRRIAISKIGQKKPTGTSSKNAGEKRFSKEFYSKNDPEFADWINHLVTAQLQQEKEKERNEALAREVREQRKLLKAEAKAIKDSKKKRRKKDKKSPKAGKCSVPPITHKSPSDTDLYVPGLNFNPQGIIPLKLPSTKESEQTANKSMVSDKARTNASSGLSEAVANQISNFVDKLRLQAGEGENVQGYKIPKKAKDPVQVSRDAVEREILAAERFKADVAAPQGKNLVNNELYCVPNVDYSVSDADGDAFTIANHIDEQTKKQDKEGVIRGT